MWSRRTSGSNVPRPQDASASDLDPIRSIGHMGAPVMVLAASKDQHTTLEESKELFEAASVPKSLWVLTGAKHQDLLAFDPRRYEERVVGFLERYLKPPNERGYRNDCRN